MRELLGDDFQGIFHPVEENLKEPNCARRVSVDAEKPNSKG
jgi:hypothetical protein